ncbi:MAG: hypothetical protein PHV82_07710 [Victivallaceae bacterium]|nr:hypothetical protein [Victivallaceae bacterium]
MTKRKDFVSDGLVTLRHKYIADNLNSLKSEEDTSASYSTAVVDKNLSLQEQQIQIYCQIRNDLDLRLNQKNAELEAGTADMARKLADNEAGAKKLASLIERFNELPKSIEFEENSGSLMRLEQLRAEFFRVKAACEQRSAENSGNQPAGGAPRISLLPELNSLTQLQMLKMGLCFALPLIIGVIVGCAIIAWAVIITWGG